MPDTRVHRFFALGLAVDVAGSVPVCPCCFALWDNWNDRYYSFTSQRRSLKSCISYSFVLGYLGSSPIADLRVPPSVLHTGALRA